MSRALTWHPFLTVRFEDDSGAPVTALRASPLPVTEERLARYGLTFRSWPDRFALFYRTRDDSAEPLVGEIGPRVRFAFALEKLGDFAGRYGPVHEAATGAVLYLDNLAVNGNVLQNNARMHSGDAVAPADAVELTGALASIGVPLGGGVPNAVEARTIPAEDVVARADVHAASGASEATVTLDLRAAPVPHLRAVSVPAGSLARGLYADDEAFARAPTGIVELYWQGRQDAVAATGGREYRAVFARP